jgi:hypothetical protein
VSDRYGEEEHTEENCVVPDWVWEHCLAEPNAILNWSANLFAGEGEVDGERYKVKVSRVEFEVGAIIALERMEHGLKLAVSEQEHRHGRPPSASGRRLSKGWPIWIAELVATIHDSGVPDGVGSQGQEELIKKVADALAERGIEGLARSTVQPVVQAVLDRLRAAEN